MLTWTGSAAAECVSEEALAHLKSYKYSSVDKSLTSYYILRHYVRRRLYDPRPLTHLHVEREYGQC